MPPFGEDGEVVSNTEVIVALWSKPNGNRVVQVALFSNGRVIRREVLRHGPLRYLGAWDPYRRYKWVPELPRRIHKQLKSRGFKLNWLGRSLQRKRKK